jgi:hypothetical protein
VYQLALRLKSHSGKTHEMLQALRSVMLPAEFEMGSMGCALYAQVDEVEALCYFEDWSTREDLEREVRSARFGRLLAVMECAAGRPTLEVHLISQTQGWDYIRHLRGEADLPAAGNGHAD